MKKIFFNENGTFKVINVVVIVDVIIATILLLMVKSMFGSIVNTGSIIKTTTTTTTTTTIDLCNGCQIAFKNEKIYVSPNQKYELEDLLHLEKINMRYVDFDISDPKLGKISVEDGKYILEIYDTLGQFVIKAYYYDKFSEAQVNIQSDKLMDIEFSDSILYVKNGSTMELKYDLIPKGYIVENSKLSIEDTSIAEIDANGNIKGKKLGKTKLTVNVENITKSIYIYVVTSNIDIKVMENFKYRDKSNIEYNLNNKADAQILLVLENTDLSNKNISYEVISDNTMTVSVNFSKKNTEFPNAYEYNVVVGAMEGRDPVGGATIIFTLTDGSKKEIRVETINKD